MLKIKNRAIDFALRKKTRRNIKQIIKSNKNDTKQFLLKTITFDKKKSFLKSMSCLKK